MAAPAEDLRLPEAWTPDTSAPTVQPTAANDQAWPGLDRLLGRRKKLIVPRAFWSLAEWLTREDTLTLWRESLSLTERIRFDRLARQRAELDRVEKLQEAWREPGPDKVTRRLLREAQEARTEAQQAEDEARQLRGQGRRKAAAASLEGAHAATRQAMELEGQAQRRIDERRQARWSANVITERQALEALRGGAAEGIVTEVADWVRDENGALARDRRGMPVLGSERARTIRLVASEGLRIAFEHGHLDGGRYSAERLLQTAKRFRDAYETCASIASPDRDLGAPSMPRCKPSAGPHDAIFDAGQLLCIMTGRISLQRQQIRRRAGLTALVRMTELEVEVLVLVAARDETVRQAAKVVGRRHETVCRSLLSGLEIATLNDGLD